MSMTYNSWSEGGSGCSCHIYTSPTSMLEAIEDEWEGAGTYQIHYHDTDYDEQETELTAETVEELADLIETFLRENNAYEDEYWNIWDNYDYAEKVTA